MRALAWDLEATETTWSCRPGVVDVAGPRLHIRPVAGLPLLHVDKPQYRGASGSASAFDVVGACALLVLSPLMLLVAVAVKVTSRGPVFYRAERIGSTASRSRCSSSARWWRAPTAPARAGRRATRAPDRCSRCVTTRG